MDGGATLGTVLLSGGEATFATSGLALGSHMISAVYGGDSDFVGNSSAPLHEIINSEKYTSQALLAVTPRSSAFGQKVTLIVTVLPPAPLDGTPTGTVTFLDGATVLGVVALQNANEKLQSARARLTTIGLHAGPNAVEAVYSGDRSFSGSTSQVVLENVGSEPTRTKVTSSRKNLLPGQLVIFTATVSSARGGETVLVGAVSFWDGLALLGTIDLSGGEVLFATRTLPMRTHTIRVLYAGQDGFASSSASLRETVK
jgi:hypothetical protein